MKSSKVSKIISEKWKSEPKKVRQLFTVLASISNEIHEKKYKNYKYKTSEKKSKKSPESPESPKSPSPEQEEQHITESTMMENNFFNFESKLQQEDLFQVIPSPTSDTEPAVLDYDFFNFENKLLQEEIML